MARQTYLNMAMNLKLEYFLIKIENFHDVYNSFFFNSLI